MTMYQTDENDRWNHSWTVNDIGKRHTWAGSLKPRELFYPALRCPAPSLHCSTIFSSPACLRPRTHRQLQLQVPITQHIIGDRSATPSMAEAILAILGKARISVGSQKWGCLTRSPGNTAFFSPGFTPGYDLSIGITFELSAVYWRTAELDGEPWWGTCYCIDPKCWELHDLQGTRVMMENLSNTVRSLSIRSIECLLVGAFSLYRPRPSSAHESTLALAAASLC